MLWALFLLIAGVWAVFLIPPMWADRRSSSMADNRRLSGNPARSRSVDRSPKRANPGSGNSRSRGREQFTNGRVLSRRRRALILLATIVLVTLSMTIAFGGLWAIALHVLADMMLAGYIVALRGIVRHREADEREQYALRQEAEVLYSSAVRVVQSR